MKKANIELFEYKVYLIENDSDIKKAKKYLKDTKIKNILDEDDYFGVCLSYSSRSYIYIKDNKLSTLTHEVLHSVQRLCEQRGIDDYETEAWLLHFILEKFIDDKQNKIKGE